MEIFCTGLRKGGKSSHPRHRATKLPGKGEPPKLLGPAKWTQQVEAPEWGKEEVRKLGCQEKEEKKKT